MEGLELLVFFRRPVPEAGAAVWSGEGRILLVRRYRWSCGCRVEKRSGHEHRWMIGLLQI